MVETNTSDQEPTQYVVRVGGENVSVTKGEGESAKTYSYYEAVISVLTTPESTTPTYTLGELDGETGVNISDAIELLKYCATLISFDDTQLLAAELDGETGVNISDAIELLKYCATLIDKFPVEQ